jgi:hypothetical protein
MPTVKLAWMRQTARVSNHLEISLESECVIANSHAFVRRIEARLEPTVLRRHSGRARVRMAAHRLDAPDRKQESAACHLQEQLWFRRIETVDRARTPQKL